MAFEKNSRYSGSRFNKMTPAETVECHYLGRMDK